MKNSSFRPSAVVLDLDGTLIDSTQDIAASANYALQQAGRGALPASTIAGFVGDGALALIQRATGLQPPNDELTRIHSVFLDYYTANATVHTQLYPGVQETLEQLRSIAGPSGKPLGMALCTNKPRITTQAVLRELDLDRYFDVVTAADDFAQKKPHPEPFLYIARKLNLEPEAMVMVGDGPQDVLCGQRAGAVTVGVTYGIKHHAEMRRAGPDFVIDTFAELLGLFDWSGCTWTARSPLR